MNMEKELKKIWNKKFIGLKNLQNKDRLMIIFIQKGVIDKIMGLMRNDLHGKNQKSHESYDQHFINNKLGHVKTDKHFTFTREFIIFYYIIMGKCKR